MNDRWNNNADAGHSASTGFICERGINLNSRRGVSLHEA
jgi:hypothetical protein